jgi:anti-anti-sigma factor
VTAIPDRDHEPSDLPTDVGDVEWEMPTIRVAQFVAGETGVVKVDGDLDAATAPHLQRSLDRFTGRRVSRMRRLALDLADVGFIDVAGFQPISDTITRVYHSGVAVEIIKPSAPVRSFLARLGRSQLISDGSAPRSGEGR